MNKRILLIGSCGGLTGYYLAKLFKQSRPDLQLWGIDSGDPSATSFYLDHSSKCPKASNPVEYFDFLIRYINENEIDYYLPTHSVETLMVSKYEDRIRNNTRVKFIISPYETYRKFNSKIDSYYSFSELGLNVPKLYLSEQDILFPAFAKPEIGSGSRNSFVLDGILDYKYFKKKYPALVVMEYLDGHEYTVDAVFDNKGKLISYNQRVRMKQMGGATIFTKNEFALIDIYRDLIRLSQKHVFKGVVNLQFILKNEEAYYTDVNLRYASGGLPLSVVSGINLPELLIALLDGKTIDPELYQSDRKNRIMYRCFEERYIVEDE